MNKWDSFMMQTAQIWANASYCKRRKVGAVIAKENRIISIGYNGTLSGTDNKCEKVFISCEMCGEMFSFEEISECHEFTCYCGTILCRDSELTNYASIITRTKDEVVHAEQNAILFAAKTGIPTQDTTLYVTVAPCINCAKSIVQAGIKRVVYLENYRTNEGIDLLKQVGVVVNRFKL